MIKFIQTVHGAQANRLLQAVLADLQDDIIICTFLVVELLG